MAASSIMSTSVITKTSIFNHSIKPFPQLISPSSLPSKASTLRFASASRSYLCGNVGESRTLRNRVYATNDASGSIGDKVKEAEETAANLNEEAKAKAYELKEATKDAATTANDKVAETAEYAKGKAEEGSGNVTETLKEAGEKLQETVSGVWGAAVDTSEKINQNVVEKGEEVKSSVEEFVDDNVKKP